MVRANVRDFQVFIKKNSIEVMKLFSIFCIVLVRVFRFELFEPLGIRYAHSAKLTAPKVVTRFREGVLAAQLRKWHPCLRFPQKANNLFFGESLLHVQSPCRERLDSKVRGYSISGGGVGGAWDHSSSIVYVFHRT